MIDFVMNNILMLKECDILGDFSDILKELFMIVKVSVPCLVLVLCSVDITRAVISQDDKGMKESLTRVVKRVSIGVCIFFVPILLEFLLKIAGNITGTCGIS